MDMETVIPRSSRAPAALSGPLFGCIMATIGCDSGPKPKQDTEQSRDVQQPKENVVRAKENEVKPKENVDDSKDQVVSLFDGTKLGHWKATLFGGEGDVEVSDGNLVLGVGDPLTGVTWQGDPPAKINYEINLEAQRTEGTDFFLGLTVPIRDKSITLVLGGWGGGTCGLSSLDDFDASENDTTKYLNFENKQWYKVRMRVLEKHIDVWLDGKRIVDCDLEGREIGVRSEIDLTKPLGICTFQSIGTFRRLTLTKLEPKVAQAMKK